MSQPEKQVYYEVAISLHDDLITKLKDSRDFTDKKFLPDSENCHFIRSTFIHNNEKVSIVFDTKAEMLTVTAYKEAVDSINAMFLSIKSKLDKKQSKIDKDIIKTKSLKTKREGNQIQNESADSINVVDLPKVRNSQKKKSSGLAEKLNSYATDRRAADIMVEKHYIRYNYRDVLNTRIENPALKYDNYPATKNSLSEGDVESLSANQAKSTDGRKKQSNTQTKSLVVQSDQSYNQTKSLVNQSKSVEKKSKALVEQSKLPKDLQVTAISQQTIFDNQTKTNIQSAKIKENLLRDNKNMSQKTNKNFEKKQIKKSESVNGENNNFKKYNQTDFVNTKTIENIAEANENTSDLLEYKDGYSVKISLNKVNNIIGELKNNTDLRMQNLGTVIGTAGDITTYSVETKDRQRVYLRHIVKKNMLQLQGRKSKLFGDIQILISRDALSKLDTKDREKEQKTLYKEVKKALPQAFDYLSEQSKIDFTIGLIDIYSEEVKLSDYSVLLVPPYRGLERLLFDLQKAKGIEVKMIGQAYEKENGSYILKAGYRKKIDSIVYNEAMSALYSEYFEKRNFYAHSDNTNELSARVISDKSQAKIVFENLLEVINYNCKKLNEINFSTKK